MIGKFITQRKGRKVLNQQVSKRNKNLHKRMHQKKQQRKDKTSNGYEKTQKIMKPCNYKKHKIDREWKRN